MTKLKYLAAFIFFQLSALLSFGQFDYVVTIKGDTLSGTVTIITAGQVDRAQLISGSAKSNYTALTARALRINNEDYHAVKLGNTYHFMKLLKPGYMSLYAYKIENQSLYNGRLLRKVTDETFDVPNIMFRSAVNGFLEDCDSVAREVKTSKLGRENLEEIVDLYNLCVSRKLEQNQLAEQIRLTKEDKKIRINEFKKQIEASDLETKAEVIGLLNDIALKVESETSIPNYQINALQDYLKGKKEFKEGLSQIMTILQ